MEDLNLNRDKRKFYFKHLFLLQGMNVPNFVLMNRLVKLLSICQLTVISDKIRNYSD